MLQLVNDTPCPAQLGLFTDHEGHQLASVVLKATFALPGEDGGVCRLAPEQLSVRTEPSYEGDTGQSSIRHPADLVPQRHRKRMNGRQAGAVMDVGVADTGRPDAHQHIVRTRRRNHNLAQF